MTAPAPRPSEREIAVRDLATAKAIIARWLTDTCEPDAETEIVRALTEARRATIEEALRICDEYGDSPDVLSAAQAIRSLASPSPGKGGGG